MGLIMNIIIIHEKSHLKSLILLLLSIISCHDLTSNIQISEMFFKIDQ
jgi:hypothetical protein